MVAHAINIHEAADILTALRSSDEYEMTLFERIEKLETDNPKASYWLQDQLSPAHLAVLAYGRWFLVHEADSICPGCMAKTVENTLQLVADMIEATPSELDSLAFPSPSVETSFQILIDTVCTSLLHAHFIRDQGCISSCTS